MKLISQAKTLLLTSLLVSASASAFAATDVSGRFGRVAVNSENVLLLNGKPIKPDVQGNNSLSMVGLLPSGDTDVIIVENNGGTACPLLVRIITLSAAGAKVSPEFGSCSDLVSYTLKGGEIIISTPKTNGNGADVFRYSNGVVTRAGRPLR